MTNLGFLGRRTEVNRYETYIFGYFDANINSLFRIILPRSSVHGRRLGPTFMLKASCSSGLDLPRTGSSLFRQSAAKEPRLSRPLLDGCHLGPFGARRSGFPGLNWSRELFLIRGRPSLRLLRIVRAFESCGKRRRLLPNTSGPAPKASETEHNRKSPGRDERSWSVIVTPILSCTGLAEPPARQQVPFNTFDLLSAIAAKVWLIEHGNLDPAPLVVMKGLLPPNYMRSLRIDKAKHGATRFY